MCVVFGADKGSTVPLTIFSPRFQASLKKHVSTPSSGTTEHIVYADHPGGHSDGYRRNTFRSMGQYAVPAPYPYEVNEELKDRDIRYLDALQ